MMHEINKAEIYRHAAEVIIRDGKCESHLTSEGDGIESIKDTSLSVCAIGACARAEWELYGTIATRSVFNREVADYQAYQFRADWYYKDFDAVRPRPIWGINDEPGVSAEDIALLLKHHAAEVEAE